MNVIDEIAAERRRQIEVEGWTPKHDDAEHNNGELALAAACYCLGREWPGIVQTLWPWGGLSWKPKDRRRDLVRAATLAVAEIERLDRNQP